MRGALLLAAVLLALMFAGCWDMGRAIGDAADGFGVPVAAGNDRRNEGGGW